MGAMSPPPSIMSIIIPQIRRSYRRITVHNDVVQDTDHLVCFATACSLNHTATIMWKCEPCARRDLMYMVLGELRCVVLRTCLCAVIVVIAVKPVCWVGGSILQTLETWASYPRSWNSVSTS